MDCIDPSRQKPPLRMTSSNGSVSGHLARFVTSITDLALNLLHSSGMPKIYHVCILASQRRVLYIGMTSGIEHRVFQHKTHVFAGFTSKYNVTTLVYFERHGSVMTAIRREKEIKAWRREEKVKLIESMNPKWKDLSYGWYQRHRSQPIAASHQDSRDVVHKISGDVILRGAPAP